MQKRLLWSLTWWKVVEERKRWKENKWWSFIFRKRFDNEICAIFPCNLSLRCGRVKKYILIIQHGYRKIGIMLARALEQGRALLGQTSLNKIQFHTLWSWIKVPYLQKYLITVSVVLCVGLWGSYREYWGSSPMKPYFFGPSRKMMNVSPQSWIEYGCWWTLHCTFAQGGTWKDLWVSEMSIFPPLGRVFLPIIVKLNQGESIIPSTTSCKPWALPVIVTIIETWSSMSHSLWNRATLQRRSCVYIGG